MKINNNYYDQFQESNSVFFKDLLFLIEKHNKKNVLDLSKKNKYDESDYSVKIKKEIEKKYNLNALLKITKLAPNIIDSNKNIIENALLHFTILKKEEAIDKSKPHSSEEIYNDLEFYVEKRGTSVSLQEIEFHLGLKEPYGEIRYSLKKEEIGLKIFDDIEINVKYEKKFEVDIFVSDNDVKNGLTKFTKTYPEKTLEFFINNKILNDVDNEFSILQFDFDFNKIMTDVFYISTISNIEKRINYNTTKKGFIKKHLKI